MRWIIGFITSSITSVIGFFVKKFGYSAVLFALQKGVQLLVIAALVSFATWAIAYILQIWNMFSDVINNFDSLNPGSGSAYGITLSTLLQSAKGFIYASGLSTALVAVGNLYISILSLLFIKALYAIYLRVVKFLYEMFTSGINILSGSIRL